jgi:hypothetical protein
MYFMDKTHETNYNHLSTMVFPHAKTDSEYHAMTYVLAVPYLYDACIEDPMFYEFPFLWTVEYKDTSYMETDEDNGEKYRVISFEIKKDNEGNEVSSREYNYLSSGYKKLAELAANLFNPSNDEFNLSDAFGTWDDRLVKVYFQAVMLRLQSRRQVDGLEVKIR